MRSYISMTQQGSPSSQPSQLPSLPPISVIYTEFPQTWIHKYTHTKSAEACCVFTKLASVLHIIVVSDTKMLFFFPITNVFFPLCILSIQGYGLYSPGEADFGNTWTVATQSGDPRDPGSALSE